APGTELRQHPLGLAAGGNLRQHVASTDGNAALAAVGQRALDDIRLGVGDAAAQHAKAFELSIPMQILFSAWVRRGECSNDALCQLACRHSFGPLEITKNGSWRQRLGVLFPAGVYSSKPKSC